MSGVVEWMATVLPYSGETTEGGAQPTDMLVWMDADGVMLGHAIAARGAIASVVAESLRRTIAGGGEARAPRRVRVESAELAAAVRAADPTIELLQGPLPADGPTPEALRRRLEAFGGAVKDQESHFSAKVDAGVMGAFFEAAAGVFRAAPWDVAPDFQCLFAVSAPDLEVFDFVLAIAAPSGPSRGALYLFADIDDYDRHLERGEDDPVPPFVTLVFGPGAELPERMRDEIAEHGWELAEPDAVPEVIVVDAVGPRGPVADELRLVEAVARALAFVLEDARALLRAWNLGVPVTHTRTVPTHAGPVAITLTAPYEHVDEVEVPDDLLGALAALEDDEELDPDARFQLESALLQRLAGSPEGASIDSVRACRVVLDTAADHLGATVASLSAEELREVLFEIIPRQVTIDPSAAEAIIAETRALYTFLEREHGLPQAGACLAVLGGGAAKNLQAALGDSSRFGMAKQIMAEGRRRGHDLGTQAGIDAWMRELESQPLPASIRLPGDAPPPRPATNPKTKKAKKDSRKATRKARQKSR